MKGMGLRLALRAAIVALAFAAAGGAGAARAAEASRQGLQGKLDYCKTCHGLSAQGYRGFYPMPRLAGQQPKYLENQLRAFIERRRTNPVMFNVAHVLSPEMVAALAAHLKELNPEPYGGAPRDSLALGKTIFEQGLPESNIPACSACHGPEARGSNEIPRLAGQLFWYTEKALNNWTKERGQGGAQDTSAIMVPTTHNLNQAQIAAVAAYVSYLK
jgi:cytochrome c553